MLRPIS